MTFEENKDVIVDTFINNIEECGIDLIITNEMKEEIERRIDEHEQCVEGYTDESPLVVTVYGDGINVSLECEHCNTVIIDTDVLFL